MMMMFLANNNYVERANETKKKETHPINQSTVSRKYSGNRSSLLVLYIVP